MGAEAEKLHIIDKDCIEKGIVELICKHNIKKLVMGAASDKYHSRFLVVSFIVDLELFIMVNDPKVRNLLLGGQRIIWRFPSSIKASKLPKYEFTPTKGSLTSGKQNSHQIDTPAQPQTQVDMNLSAKLYSALRLLRATILGESGDNVLAHHVLWAKVSNYGDQILETIENTINEYYKLDKSSNGSADSAKRRRDANGGLDKILRMMS
ncbi:ATP-dependent DNA helicase Q-like 4A [Arachis hypogaea]|nr:ATP-dependent DNA helicase Q-like 4A [Arachis hypogaea]